MHADGETEWRLKERARERVFVFLFSAETTKFSCICMYLLTTFQSWSFISFATTTQLLVSLLTLWTYPSFPVQFIAVTLFVQFLLNLLISPKCCTPTLNCCHSNWHPIFHFFRGRAFCKLAEIICYNSVTINKTLFYFMRLGLLLKHNCQFVLSGHTSKRLFNSTMKSHILCPVRCICNYRVPVSHFCWNRRMHTYSLFKHYFI
jgi:hypothetical protein